MSRRGIVLVLLLLDVFLVGLLAVPGVQLWRELAGFALIVLAVVPAVLSFRARSDGRWRPGLPALLDVAAVLLITAFSVFGWRHLRDAT